MAKGTDRNSWTNPLYGSRWDSCKVTCHHKTGLLQLPSGRSFHISTSPHPQSDPHDWLTMHLYCRFLIYPSAAISPSVFLQASYSPFNLKPKMDLPRSTVKHSSNFGLHRALIKPRVRYVWNHFSSPQGRHASILFVVLAFSLRFQQSYPRWLSGNSVCVYETVSHGF